MIRERLTMREAVAGDPRVMQILTGKIADSLLVDPHSNAAARSPIAEIGCSIA
jgi:hypothetical protein